jgi:hypothetical protein
MGASALLLLLLAFPAGALSRFPKILGPGPGNPPADGGDNASVGGIFSSAGNLSCSGSLIQRHYIVTAAHCTTHPALVSSVRFESPGGVFSEYDIDFSGSTVHPDFDPATFANDVAVLKLTTAASLPLLSLYTGRDEVGMIATVVGWGVTNDTSSNRKRSGTNAVDSIVMDGNVLRYVFDSSEMDVAIAEGDSGGASLIGGALAGIHSFGNYADFDLEDGDVFGDTRVSSYVGFIQSAVPEPASAVLLGGGVLVLTAWARRRPSLSRRR